VGSVERILPQVCRLPVVQRSRLEEHHNRTLKLLAEGFGAVLNLGQLSATLAAIITLPHKAAVKMEAENGANTVHGR
jgi:hypothetical protein